MKKVRFMTAVAMCALIVLAGCGDDDKESKDAETARELAKVKAPLPICPQVAIVRKLGSMRDYGSATPDPAEFVAFAAMQSVDGHCDYQKDGIDVTFDLTMMATRGPRLGTHAAFPYFVALVDPDNNVLAKDLMTADFNFSDDDKTVNYKEPLHVFIPLALANRTLGSDYRVLLGFQVPEDQLSEKPQKQK